MANKTKSIEEELEEIIGAGAPDRDIQLGFASGRHYKAICCYTEYLKRKVQEIGGKAAAINCIDNYVRDQYSGQVFAWVMTMRGAKQGMGLSDQDQQEISDYFNAKSLKNGWDK